MSRDEIEKLLGGYATGTLTPGEREALFAAALEDQQIFDALAREEPLRELLRSPAAKSRLLAALEVERIPWYRVWLRPALLAAGVAGIAVVAVVVQHQVARRPQTVAVAQLPEALRPEPLASPLPRALEKRAIPAVPRASEVTLKAVAPRPAPAAPVPPAVDAVQAAAVEKAAAEQAVSVPVAGGAAPAPAARQAVQGLRLTRAASPLAGVGGVVSLGDAQSLFYGTPVPLVQNNFFSAESRGLAPARAAVTATVADTVAKTPAAYLGLRYTVLRRSVGGFSEVTPGQELDPGDEFALRFQPNDAGYLYVLQRGSGGDWNLIATDLVPRMAWYVVPAAGAAVGFGDSRLQEFFVLFSRQALSAAERVPTAGENQTSGGNPLERAAYVASTSEDPAQQRIAFSITVRRK